MTEQVPSSELVSRAAAKAFIDGSKAWSGNPGWAYAAGLRAAAPIILAEELHRLAAELRETIDSKYGSTDAFFAYDSCMERVWRRAAELSPPEKRNEAS